jgi:hypothetical protein
MKRNSFFSHLIQLALGILVLSALLYLVNEFSFHMVCRYCCIGGLLLLLNRSRSLVESDAHMLIVGLIISTCGLTALFFNWSLAYEVCLLGGIFTVVGYISFLNQLSEFRLFEYAAILFLFCCMLYIIFKLASWQGTDIIEIAGLAIVSFLFLIQDTKKKEDRSSSEIEENSPNKMLV